MYKLPFPWELRIYFSWARPAIPVAGMGSRGGNVFYFFCFFTFIPVPFSSLSIPFISTTISLYLFSLSLGDDTKLPTRVDVSLKPYTIKKIHIYFLEYNCLEQLHVLASIMEMFGSISRLLYRLTCFRICDFVRDNPILKSLRKTLELAAPN